MRKIVSCGVLIVQGDPIERFLLMEHADRLDLPKGHLDAGETELECALRELEEETSIRSSDIQLVPGFRFTHDYSVRPKKYNREECRKTLAIFLGRLMCDVEIIPTEHLGFHWVEFDPPHTIQAQTIDPLLAELCQFLGDKKT